MEEFVLGLLVGVGVGTGASKSLQVGEGVYFKLRAYFNRRRYERFLEKAKAQGVESEYQEAFMEHGGFHEFGYQTGMESMRAYHLAKAKAR